MPKVDIRIKCRGCQTFVPQYQLRDSLCLDCKPKADKAAGEELITDTVVEVWMDASTSNPAQPADFGPVQGQALVRNVLKKLLSDSEKRKTVISWGGQL